MSVIINVIDLPNTCHECTLRNKSMCEVTGLYLPTLDERNEYCPIRSIDGLLDEFKKRYPKNYAGDFELGGHSCEFSLTQVIRIIKEYCEAEE